MAYTHDSHEWLSLIDVSGPFLAVPVLENAFPQGLDRLDSRKKKDLRQAYDEWREALDLDDEQLPEIHQAWIELVLKQGLELDEDGEEDTLKPRNRLPESLTYRQLEYGVTLRPDYAVVDDQKNDKPLMLISIHGPDVGLDSTLEGDGWATTPVERMVQLCRATETRLGLLTNGERWVLVDAPVGAVTTFASWYARLWSQEPITLQAFVTLLGVRRFFVDKGEQLPALLDDSLKHQDDVTDALGKQVQRAVEVLIQALDRADVDRNRELLEGVEPTVIYEAALTVMMRLVFLLSAEERELMDVVKDERFQANYAVSSLRMQLREQAGLHSEEILSHRRDAWSRLLAIFRAVYGGIEHEALRMPALGGSLFDPDRFPFLEGRARGTSWRTDEARPLPIDNRTVLLLLDAIQLFQGRTLSYRALDVENIGYVYEGLLERTVERAREVVLDLDSTKSAKKPWVSLGELELAQENGQESAEVLLKDRTGSSIGRVRNGLKKSIDPTDTAKLLTSCHNDQALCDRIEPYFHLLRIDDWGYPLVYPEGTFMVTTGSNRRETGTHYTPKSLTEAIVRETLEPVVYVGPAEGTTREEWKLKSPAELLDLKICDPAMGSGAFLVQVCRWLSERLVEAWEQAEGAGKVVTINGEVAEGIGTAESLPTNSEERLVTARRLIAERCIYGVDINPMAVELAKLSIWLVTLAKGRPFGFLDHNLRAGDSLLGIHNLDQLYFLDMNPTREGSGRKLFAQAIDSAVSEAIELRKRLRQRVIRDIHDVEIMAELDREAHQKLELPELIADMLVGEVLVAGGKAVDMAVLAIEVGRAIDGNTEAIDTLTRKAKEGLLTDFPGSKTLRHSLHWPLEFPEVFVHEDGGFDVIVGNPPFLGGQRITGAMGTAYRSYLVSCLANGVKGSADLVAYFFLQSYRLLRNDGDFGLLAVNTIAEGDTRQVGLERLVSELGATIYAAYPNEPWLGKAAVFTSRIHIRKGGWKGKCSLLGQEVPYVSPFLTDHEEWSPKRLKSNKGIAFQGCITRGMGFVISPEAANHMFAADKKNAEVIFPYINGNDLNSDPEQSPSRWVINFWDWPLERAQKYELPWQWIEERVKPDRFRKKGDGRYVCAKPLREEWWLFEGRRSGLFHAIGRGHYFLKPSKFHGQLNKVISLGTARLTKHLMFPQIKGDFVPSDQVVIFSVPNLGWQTIFESAIHQSWAWQYRATRGVGVVGLRYSPTDLVETFALPNCMFSPDALLDDMGLLGQQLNAERSKICHEQNIGLTKLYNRFHNPEEVGSYIQNLRDLHIQINEMIAKAYNWNDLDLEHDFHAVAYLPENDRVRFTISEKVRVEVLQRLAMLNKERYEEEFAKGLHPAKKGSKKKVVARKKRHSAKVYEIPSYSERDILKAAEPPSPQMDIFANQSNLQPSDKRGSKWGNEPIDQILTWLGAHPGWHNKQAIFGGCLVEESGWNAAIKELLKDGFVEVQNEGSPFQYRAKI